MSVPVPTLLKEREPPVSPIAPDKVMSPAEVPMLLLAKSRVMAPLKLAFVAEVLRMAPVLEMPVPLRVVMFSAPTVCPFKSSAEPLAMAVPAAVEPRPLALPKRTVALLVMVVVPE